MAAKRYGNCCTNTYIFPSVPPGPYSSVFCLLLAGVHFYLSRMFIYILTIFAASEPKGQLPAVTFKEFRTHLSGEKKAENKKKLRQNYGKNYRKRQGVRSAKETAAKYVAFRLFDLIYCRFVAFPSLLAAFHSLLSFSSYFSCVSLLVFCF